MSLTSALSNSLSGLQATARAAEVVSSNVANANTDGYGVRSLNTSANSTTGAGGGVRVDGIGRRVDTLSQASRRSTDAELGQSQTRAAFFDSLQFAMGMPEDPGSLSSLVGAFEADLLSASARPDIDQRLENSVNASIAVADKLNVLSDHVQQQRETAEAEISAAVTRLNTSLSNIEELNARIRTVGALGHDTSSLKDARDQQIDAISDLVPVRVIEQDFDQIALVSDTGTFLVNGPAVQFSFDTANTITPDMTLTSGALQPLVMDGRPLDMNAAFNPVAGGRIEALFDVRDQIAPEAQRQLDVVAQDLIERTTGPTIDPTWMPGSPGIFTDAGATFVPANLEGLSGRLSVNADLVPSQGGAVYRLRDGLFAATPGDTGNDNLLLALRDALAEDRTTPLIAGQTHSGSAQSLSGALLSEITANSLEENDAVAFSAAKWSSFRDAELSAGVDIDQEMQRLLRIEEEYAANAKVIQTADELLRVLMEIT